MNTTKPGPIKLSTGTWVGIATIAVPTIAALAMGVLGVYDVKNGLAELQKEVRGGFEKTDANFVLVRERVARLEAVNEMQRQTPVQPAPNTGS